MGMRFCGYRGYFTPEEFAQDYDAQWKRLDGANISSLPTSFPVFYKYIEPYDYHFCGHFKEVEPQEVIASIEEDIELDKRIIANIYEHLT